MNPSIATTMRRVSLAGLAVVTLLLASRLTPSNSAQALQSLPQEDFWRLVIETRQAVTQAGGLEPDEASAHLSAYAERWAELAQVVFPDGGVMRVDGSYFSDRLRERPPDSAALGELLDALLAANTPPQAGFTGEDVQSIEAILERPEFQWQPEQASPIQEWIRSIEERFFHWLARLLANSGVGRALKAWQILLAVTGLSVILLALGYLVRNLMRVVVAESELETTGEAGDERLTAGEALQKAQASSSGGDYRTAVRYLYLSALLSLEERGVLSHNRSRTNREYLRSLAQKPALAAIMREVVEVFDRVWYGFQPLDEADYARYAERVEELQQQR